MYAIRSYYGVAALDQGIERLSRQRADARLEPVDVRALERAGQGLAPQGLLGRIEVQRRSPTAGRHARNQVLHRVDEGLVVARDVVV